MMQRPIRIAAILVPALAAAAADRQWVLERSNLTYHVSHPLHQSEGVSRAARGKGICHAGECQFLVAAPVKSFDSGDSNRDLHMLQATRGAEFPLVSVKARLPEAEIKPGAVRLDLEVQLAGHTAEYKQVPFELAAQGSEMRITGTIPATLSDFKIEAPSLLAIPVKNDMPVRVDLTWRPSSGAER